MADLIDNYFSKHLELPWEEAVKLHKEYYTNYGLAIEGLVRHHQIDPLDYNAKVDDALPLEGIIKPNPELRELLEDIDKSKVTVWLFTNAYVNHGKRVVRLLGIEDIFDGLTYCNYAEQPMLCKPDPRMYEKAMREAGVERVEDCFFVGKFTPLSTTVPSNFLRRFWLELRKGQGIRLDSSPSRRRGSACSRIASFAVPNPALARTTQRLPPVLQVYFQIEYI